MWTRLCSVVLVALAGLALGVGTADADSDRRPTQTSCANWHNVIDVRQIPVYSSSICGFIGQGPDVRTGTRMSGTFNTVGYQFLAWPSVCHYWVDVDIFDPDGDRYFHNQGQTVPHCSSTITGESGNRVLDADYVLRPDSEVCVTMWRRTHGEIERVVRTCGVLED